MNETPKLVGGGTGVKMIKSFLNSFIRFRTVLIFSMRIKNALLIKSKIAQWLNKPKWLNRLTLYSIFFAIVITISAFIFSYFGFLHTDVDSARYMLSAFIQSEAAIVALVVTLSLVAVQLAAQSYSARVIEVFRRTPDLWILMGIYGFAIFFGSWVLKLIDRDNVSEFEIYISGAYYLGVFAFAALVPYIWNTLETLKPSVVINILAREINKKNILAAIQEDREEMTDGITSFSYSRGFPRVEKDPILPIIDIVRSSLMKFDFETVKEGLMAIKDRIDDILISETLTMEEERRVSIYIFDHLTGIGKLAASRNDEVSIAEVINCIQKIAIRAAMKELKIATEFSLIYLNNVGKIAAEQEFADVTRRVIDSLEFIGRTAALHKIETATERAAISLENVWIAAVKLDVTTFAIKALETLIKVAKEQKLEKATNQAVNSINVINKARSRQK